MSCVLCVVKMINNTRSERRDTYQTGTHRKEGGGEKRTFFGHLSRAGFYTSHFHTLIKESCAAAAKSHQLCPTLCNPGDGSPPGSSVPESLQAGTLEWVAISFSSAWKGKVKVKLLSHVRLFSTPWIAARQAPPSMGFSRQEYWSGLPVPSLHIWHIK